MAASKPEQQDSTPVRIGNRLSETFDQVEERIRDLAYQIFRGRDTDAGNSMTDWLEAQMQVLTPVELVVKDQKKNLVVEGNLKGFTPKEIEIDVGGGQLRVFGTHTESKKSGKGGSSQTSSESAYFFQAVPLPCPVDEAKSQARLLKNGKLTITLPKKSPEK